MKNETNVLFSVRHPLIQKLIEVNRQITDLASIYMLLIWDQETYMPKGAAEARGEQFATLAGLSHRSLISFKIGKLLDALEKEAELGTFTIYDLALIRESRREYERRVRVPRKLVEELARVTSVGIERWRRARQESDFSLFYDTFAKVFDLKLKEADCVGYGQNPYDLFLDDYEPGLTAATLDAIFTELREITFLVLERIRASNRKIDQEILRKALSEKELGDFSVKILEGMNFNRQCGRLDTSTHPFSAGIHPTDVRITTRFKEQFFTSTLFSIMHEAGHALYEQGIDRRLARTLLCGGASFGLHESQSRFWENYIGKSASFWDYCHKDIVGLSEKHDFFAAINAVEPNFIRVDSDEVTYNLHIILRFEIERDLFSGRLRISELPEAWNEKVKGYLGLTVPDDARGVLQDIHWSAGNFGYFPTYSLGNLYAAQIYQRVRREFSQDFERQIAAGSMGFLQAWLEEHIHRYGKTYQPNELIKMVTGEALNLAYFKKYVFEKFGQIYGF